MGELESKEGVYSLDNGFAVSSGMLDNPNGPSADWNVPDAEGDFTDARGRRWAADVRGKAVRSLSRPSDSPPGQNTTCGIEDVRRTC